MEWDERYWIVDEGTFVMEKKGLYRELQSLAVL
jgi:hypothetical protein